MGLEQLNVLITSVIGLITSGNTTGANMQPVAVVNFIIHTGKA